MELQNTLVNMVNVYKDFSIANGDYIITSTKNLEVVNGEQILEVEMLMPVTYRMPVEETYTFKSKLKLTNALYAKLIDITKLQDTLNMMDQYIIDQKLQPITSAYLVQKKENNQPCIEIYIGINPNIL